MSELALGKDLVKVARFDQNRWADAEQLQITVMEQVVAILGAEHPIALQSMTRGIETLAETGEVNEQKSCNWKSVSWPYGCWGMITQMH